MRNVFLLTTLFLSVLSLSVWVHQKEKFNRKNILDTVTDEREESIKESDGPLEFLKFHRGIRTRSVEDKPGYPKNYQWKELENAKQFSTLRKSNSNYRTENVSNGVSAFKERGPGNVPGRTRGIIVDPDDATHKTWFLGSASGGIWKTTDGGSSWQWLTPSVSNMATTCLEMAASNHNTIYAGTGEGFVPGLVDGVDGVGVFKSIDKGSTWNLLTNSEIMGSVNRIAVDPSNENNVIVACNSGIYQSADGGNSWNKVYSGVVQDLRATPSNFSVLYATEYAVGVIKSIDGGNTWNKSNVAMVPQGRVEIAISLVNTNWIIASAEGALSGSNSDLYLSIDAGNTWYLVSLSLSGKIVDWLSNQGWYDNTVAFSPYDQNVVYVGGVNEFQVTLGSAQASATSTYSIQSNNTSSFLSLYTFQDSSTGLTYTVETGTAANKDTIQVRFGPGITQKAHRFLVPIGATSGVPDASYTYQDYVDVPFQVWDISTNKQLMCSFRDQNRNGFFDLIAFNASATDATQQSREYIFISNVPYSTTPNSSIASPSGGGQTYQEMFFFWPFLANGATWDPSSLPTSNLQINYSPLNRYSSTVKTVADAYNNYNGINQWTVVHPDHHNIYPIKQSDVAKTFQLLDASDGGVYITGISTSPGTTQGDWTKVGNGYNTSQFYGVDKRPGAQEYLGGMQDNQTYFTPSGTVASAATYYTTNIQLAGDGFEVLWHSFDYKKMIGGTYENNFARSLDGGATWAAATSGFPLKNGVTDPSKFPFISKLASSKQSPDNIYSVGADGVWRSTNFGGSWTVTSIPTGWSFGDFTDVEVSRANPTIVWAGSGQYANTTLFVSTDAGVTFNPVANPSGYTLGNITRIATHPLDQNTAYALYSYSNYAKILKTTDLGQTWTDISGFGTGVSGTIGFPDVAVYSLYVRPDNPNIIWAGTEIGIVETLDGGSTWNLSSEFPNVPVWDMKGQDNEIVIATHGRGIWTAEVGVDQNGVSKILTWGTSPQSKFKVEINVPMAYDSIQIKVNTQKISFVPSDTGTYILQIANAPTGNVTVQTISYRGANPTYSPVSNAVNFQLSSYQNKFFDYFSSVTNFYLNGFQLQPFGNSNSSLQTAHNYPNNQSETAELLVPIIVSAGTSSFIFDDVAIVQPGANGSVFGQASFNDYVIAEATKDGLTWKPIANGYNASSNANWLSTYNSKQSGSQSLTVTENFDLKNNFNAGDTLLIRFRLTSNADNIVSWGWSIDNLYIQQTPTAVEPVNEEVSIYPNPSTGKFNISYFLSDQSDLGIDVWDITGRQVLNQNTGIQNAGNNQVAISLESSPAGVYVVRLKANSFEKTLKIVVTR